MTEASSRADQIQAFLSQSHWHNWERTPLAGDASNRRYERLLGPDAASVVLMDADPKRGEDVVAFVQIAEFLRAQGLSAPKILAQDPDIGVLIIEDLGDGLFARMFAHDPSMQEPLYARATDVLVALHQVPPPALDPLGPREMADMTRIAFEKYRSPDQPAPSPKILDLFTDQLEDILRHTVTGDMVLVQRDYHAENMLWLPDRTGIAQVGLLDFQDAKIGHRAYDLVSMLQDARRDVPPEIEEQMVDRYITATGVDGAEFRRAYAVLGVQRNLRILGVFARLSREYGKPHYIDFVPRVWEHVRRGLNHPALATIAETVLAELPEPEPAFLQYLKGNTL
ncbi:phosphotransferase [Phaeobacter sp.]|uniref:aminoglycoside phosphotransferase family protein n=1 Tax=Phaeobacter sp. TaxID=1902409 RepID=UPI0025CC15B6|nr:phosphotransferase [Phaeobacter sp.]